MFIEVCPLLDQSYRLRSLPFAWPTNLTDLEVCPLLGQSYLLRSLPLARPTNLTDLGNFFLIKVLKKMINRNMKQIIVCLYTLYLPWRKKFCVVLYTGIIFLKKRRKCTCTYQTVNSSYFQLLSYLHVLRINSWKPTATNNSHIRFKSTYMYSAMR